MWFSPYIIRVTLAHDTIENLRGFFVVVIYLFWLGWLGWVGLAGCAGLLLGRASWLGPKIMKIENIFKRRPHRVSKSVFGHILLGSPEPMAASKFGNSSSFLLLAFFWLAGWLGWLGILRKSDITKLRKLQSLHPLHLDHSGSQPGPRVFPV